jgi:glycerol-3-phosphate acyltransferase PlsY
MPLLTAALVIAGAYLLGGIPWGLLLGWWWRGVDIRQHGSGMTGATNAARTLGWRISALIFLLDLAKGSGAILLARALTGEPLVEALAGVAAVAGHCWSPYIRFGGGRGVATGIGGTLATVPLAVLAVLPVGLLVMGLTRYVSLASILGAATVPIGIIVSALLGYSPLAYIVYGLGGAAIIIGKHHDNIRRLLAGTERRLGERVAVGGTAARPAPSQAVKPPHG